MVAKILEKNTIFLNALYIPFSRVLVQQLKEHSEANCNCCDYEGENEFEITDRLEGEA